MFTRSATATAARFAPSPNSLPRKRAMKSIGSGSAVAMSARSAVYRPRPQRERTGEAARSTRKHHAENPAHAGQARGQPRLARSAARCSTAEPRRCLRAVERTRSVERASRAARGIQDDAHGGDLLRIEDAGQARSAGGRHSVGHEPRSEPLERWGDGKFFPGPRVGSDSKRGCAAGAPRA